MGRFKTLLSFFISGMLFLIPVVGQGATEKVLKVRFGSDITGMDPGLSHAIEDQTVCQNLYNGLVKYDEKTNKILPDISERWVIAPNGKEYTFFLRKGVKWHKDFGEVTAEDVKYSYERIMDPKTKSRYIGEFKMIDKVEVTGPHTVKIFLKQPYAGFLHKVAAFNQGFIVNRKAIEKFGDNYQFNPIGTGPFIFDRWVPGSETHLVANKNYFEGPPKIDKVIIKLIKEETAAEVALINGEVDIFHAMQSSEVIKRLKKEKGITVLQRPSNHTINLILNSKYTPLSDKRVRQAIAYGINRKSLIEDFFEGLQGEATGILTSNFPEATKDVKKYPYDPSQAKKLLDEAGYGKGFSLDLVSFDLSPYYKMVVPMADDLKKIGIDAKIKILERGAYGQARGKGDIHTCITGVVGPPDPDRPLWVLYHSSSFPPGLNTAHYNKIDDLLEAVRLELDPTKRLNLYHRIQKTVAEDTPLIPLYEMMLFMGHRNNVKNVTQGATFTFSLYPISLE